MVMDSGISFADTSWKYTFKTNSIVTFERRGEFCFKHTWFKTLKLSLNKHKYITTADCQDHCSQ